MLNAMVFKHSKYPNAAKAYIQFMMESEQYDPWLTGCLGYWSHTLRAYAKSAVWDSRSEARSLPQRDRQSVLERLQRPDHTRRRPSQPNTSWCRCARRSPPARRRRRRRRARPSAALAAISADLGAPRLERFRRYGGLLLRGSMTATAMSTHWPRTRAEQSWLVRLFDYKPFLVFICLLPACGLLLVFLTYPLGLGIWLAFTDTTIGRGGQWVGLENFEYLLEDKVFWQAVFYSVFYTSVATVAKFGLGLWLALLLNNHLPFKSLLRAIILLPWIVPTVLSAIAFWWIYDPQFSIISYVFVDVLGLRDTIFRFPRLGLAGALVADRRQCLARHSVRRDLAARRPADHLAVALRGGADRRRERRGSASASSRSRCCCRSSRS